MGCPHAKGDEICADCAVLNLAKSAALPEDATAQTIRRIDSTDSQDRPTTEAQAQEKIGRYVIQDVLGRGGMGLVYTAFDPVLNRKVAIKVLRARPGKGTSAGGESTRLLREAQAMAQLSHPNVVPVYDFGVAGDDVFVAMELVKGLTLYDWVKQNKPTWKHVLPIFLSAGRGLEAAHAAGLVHRDFKPTNVLLDDKLQPHITDFGLARSLKSSASDDSHSGDDFDISQPISFDTPLTRAGQVMGSPGYMAPEQYDGASTSPATDQYAFCVALYEALYGKRPFRGPDLKALGELARKGEVPQPPPGSTVPRWLYDVVRKGLSPKPDARYPSMAALLDALSKDPAQRRNKVIAGMAAGLVALGLIAFVTWNSVQASRACRADGQQIAEVWNARARAAGEKAFLATGKPWAQAAWEHARAAIDRHTAEWTAARVEACEATRVRGEQSQHQLGLREACLDQERDELTTLTATFAEADVTVVNQAADAVARLTPVSACGNLQTLELRARAMPQDPGRWKTLHRDVADGRLKVAAGQLAAARATIDAAVAAADQLGEPGLIADAFEARAELEKAAGRFVESRAAYERAAQSALIAGDDAGAARHLAALVSMVGWRMEKPAEGLTLAGLARGMLTRAGGDPVLGARIDEGEGDAQWQAGNRPASLASYKRAHDALLTAQGEKSLDVARLKSSIGWVEFEQGKFTEARAKLNESRAIRESMLGPDHPVLAETWNELGNLAQLAGEYDEAVRCFLRSLEIRQVTLEADASPFTRMLLNIADAYADGGKTKEARPYVVRARANLAKTPNVPPTWTTQAYRVEARVLAGEGKFAEALKLADDAARLSRAQLGAAHPETAVTLRSLALVMIDAGKPKEALAALDDYLQVVAKLGPNEGADEPMGHVYAARALLKLKRPAEAVERIEKSLALLAGMTGHKALKAEAQLTLADALWTVGDERPRARELGVAAQALFESVNRLDDAQRAKAWVEAHR